LTRSQRERQVSKVLLTLPAGMLGSATWTTAVV
jgi:hypothetical protein